MNEALAFVGSVLLCITVAAADPAIRALDADHNGVLDIEEVETAAAELFAALDASKDGTLDAQELAGRLTANDLVDMDLNQDGKLDRNEFAKAVAIRFRAADADGNGTLDVRELNAAEGITLLRLVQ